MAYDAQRRYAACGLFRLFLGAAFLLGLVLSSCLGCSGARTKYGIIASLKNACDTPGAHQVRLADLTPFEWDTLYLFDRHAGLDAICGVLGKVEGGTLNETYSRKLVFVKAGKIAYFESEYVSFED